MSIPKVLLFILFAYVSSKNAVIIGDSRVCGFAYSVLGMDYTYHNSVYGTGSYIINGSGKNYGGHLVKIVAEVGASYSTFTNKSKAVYTGVHNILGKAAAGTVVLMWLGVNNLDSTSTFNYYLDLATKYKTLTFYAVSVAGVSQSKSGISNNTIKTFNTNMKTKVNNAKLSNFKYKSIVNGDDVTQVKGSTTFYISDSTTDAYGVHFTGSGNKECLNALLSGI